MTKPNPAAADLSDVAGVIKTLAPVQESLERFHQASEKLSSTYSQIATHQLAFLQKTVFDTLTEFQGLSRVRNPAEFVELGREFAWQQAERSFKALTELSTEVCGCWFEALKAPEFSPKAAKHRAMH